MTERRTALAAAVVLAVAVLLVRVVLPPRYPSVEGTLRVTATDGAVSARGAWATDGPVPERRRDCTTTVVVLPPPGTGATRWSGDAVPLAPDAPEVRRVLDQYAGVLPPELPLRLAAWALPAAASGALRWEWDGAGDAGAGLRAWVAPVCPETVHGLTELRR